MIFMISFLYLLSFSYIHDNTWIDFRFLLFIFFSCHQNKASLLLNKNFQILHYHINMKTLYSKLCDFAYMNNNSIFQWKDKLIKYFKNINFDFISTQKNYQNFINQLNSTIFVLMSVEIFNILINQSTFILFFNINTKIVLIHITCHFSLNQKQYLICEKILIHFLNYKNNQNDNL
jgi:hypothetical protein